MHAGGHYLFRASLGQQIRISITLRDSVFNELAPCGRATMRTLMMRMRHFDVEDFN